MKITQSAAVSLSILLFLFASFFPFDVVAFDKKIYAVQKKLLENDCDLDVDGIAGRQTDMCIRLYRLRNDLSDSVEIDAALLKSLGVTDKDINAATKPKKVKKIKKSVKVPLKNPYPGCNNLYIISAGDPYLTGDFKNFKPDFRGWACCDGTKSNWKSTVNLLPFEVFHGKNKTTKWNKNGELVVVVKSMVEDNSELRIVK